MTATVAIVTCGPQLEVALVEADRSAPSLVRLAGGSPRSRLLLAAVDLLIEDWGLARSDVGRVVVTRGPGSFTGIRSGLATAAGLEVAVGAEVVAYDSLIAHAARCPGSGTVWAAQPGRRGEVYARRFELAPGRAPEGLGEIEIVAAADAGRRGPWVAPDALDLGAAGRAPTIRSAAEALLQLLALGVPSQPCEPLYVEPPPIHRSAGGG